MGVLINGVIETVKDRPLVAVLAPLAASLVQPMISSVAKLSLEEKLEEREKDIKKWIKNFNFTPSKL